MFSESLKKGQTTFWTTLELKITVLLIIFVKFMDKAMQS